MSLPLLMIDIGSVMVVTVDQADPLWADPLWAEITDALVGLTVGR